MSSSSVVLDASALLAMLHNETGSDVVLEHMAGNDAYVCSVNLCEVASKFDELGKSAEDFRVSFGELGIAVKGFDEALALDTAKLRKKTRELGLSLGDRACIALSKKMDCVAVTADSAWQSLDDEFKIALIR